jgi:hypothetical protein
VWELKGIRPGMSFEQARGDRTFNEFIKFRDPLGYRRYIWQASDRLEKIDLHVDVASDPTKVIGVMTTIPTVMMPADEYLKQILERWGEPYDISKQGAFDLYTWTSAECDVDARATVMNQYHDVGVFVAVASISGRAELARRKQEAEKEEAGSGPRAPVTGGTDE